MPGRWSTNSTPLPCACPASLGHAGDDLCESLPVMTFPDLPPVLADALTQRGYETLTPVQDAVLEPDAKGRDLVVSAQTGSGKTVAFGLAVADQVLNQSGRVTSTARPLVLVIAPTRELALQVSRELDWLYRDAGARIATCVGGMNPQQERRALQSGATIVVGTPGRLRDHLERGALDLSALAVVVLDEADEMLDMGFREELEEILDATPDTRRMLMFSATMPRPIEALARRYQKDALRITTAGSERGHGDITYQAVTVSPSEIENAVVNLLRFHEAETAILFCATREKVRHLHAVLQERGFGVVALSGEHSQSERNQALQALRDRRARVCVATDVAARGIDLPSLSLVIHVEIPRDAETLQHRSGRTGRAGKKGIAALIVPFPRRKRVESMLRHAKINAEWISAPDRDAIIAQDRLRLLEKLMQPVAPSEADRELAAQLLASRSAEDIATMLVQMHRSAMPEPEELLASAPDAQRPAKQERDISAFADSVWFKMDIGHRQNADPRWLLPLICRRGHITRSEIGAIRVGQRETHFQVPRMAAEKFAAAVASTAGSEENGGYVAIEPASEPPHEQPRRKPHRGKPHSGPGTTRAKPVKREQRSKPREDQGSSPRSGKRSEKRSGQKSGPYSGPRPGKKSGPPR